MSSTHTRTMGSVNVWCWKTHKHQLLPQIHHISTLTVCLSWKFYHSNFSFGITRNKNESITICGVFKSKTICKWNLSFYSKWFFKINRKIIVTRLVRGTLCSGNSMVHHWFQTIIMRMPKFNEIILPFDWWCSMLMFYQLDKLNCVLSKQAFQSTGGWMVILMMMIYNETGHGQISSVNEIISLALAFLRLRPKHQQRQPYSQSAIIISRYFRFCYHFRRISLSLCVRPFWWIALKSYATF